MSDRFQQNIKKNICEIKLIICQISEVRFRERKLEESLQRYFDRIQQPDIKDINRISRISIGYQGLLYTGYHELSPLGAGTCFKQVISFCYEPCPRCVLN